MKTYIGIGLFMLLFTACKSADPAQTEAEARRTHNLIESRNYELTMDWATPSASNTLIQLSNARLLPEDSRTGRINLMGSSSYIRTKGDSLLVYLPYFGTQQLSIRPGNTNGAIQFEGLPESYEAVYNDKKQLTNISFRMKDRGDLYEVAIKVYGNKKANVDVNSIHRSSIRYTGELSAFKEN